MRLTDFTLPFFLWSTSTCYAETAGFEVTFPVSWSDGKDTKTTDVRVPIVPANGEMQVKVGSVPLMPGFFAAKALSEALKQDKKSLRFRVSRESCMTSRVCFHSSALYNRQTKVLKYFRTDFDQSGALGQRTNISLSQVTESAIHKVAENNYTDSETSGLTATIAKLGARITYSRITYPKAKRQ